jgi:hypothetical protein
MFIVGLLVGLVVGGTLGAGIMALISVGKSGDK